jgi:hypothetical protein
VERTAYAYQRGSEEIALHGKGLAAQHFEEVAAISQATGVCKNTRNNMEVLDWNGTDV